MLDPYDNYSLVKQRILELTEEKKYYHPGPPSPVWPWIALLILVAIFCIGPDALAASVPRLPGTDQSDKLQAAGSLLRLIDTALFSWGARIIAGLLIMYAGISLKNHAFGLTVILIIGAIIVGTAPMWVKNIFDMGGGTLFSMVTQLGGVYA